MYVSCPFLILRSTLYALEYVSTRGINSASGSMGYIGLEQIVCPNEWRFALVEPGASTLKLCSAQSSKKRGWQCGDFTIIE